MKYFVAVALVVYFAGQTLGLQCKGTDPNATFRSGCAWCHCENDRPVCFPDIIPDEPRCTGNPEFSYGDGWCKCVDGSVVCEKKTPAPSPNPEAKAEEVGPVVFGACNDTTHADQWRSDMGTCYCSGGRAHCYPNADEARAQCSGAPEWTENLKWCTCKAGVKQCNQDYTGPEITSEVRVYRDNGSCTGDNPSDEWLDEDGCNFCFCKHSLPLCTVNTCTDEEKRKAIAKGECLGLPNWRRGQDWCQCINKNTAFCGPDVPKRLVVKS